MRKPSRLPPAPPLPPRSHGQSNESLAHTTRTSCYESCYAKSVCSEEVSVRSEQLAYRSRSERDSNYNSARSETSFYYPIRTCKPTPAPYCTQCYPCCQPSNRCLMPQNRCYPPSHCSHMVGSRQSIECPPIPRERTFRPKRSLSPMPVIKVPTRQRLRYESLDYRRHIEQYIERLFKYLTDRQKRIKKYIAQNIPLDNNSSEHQFAEICEKVLVQNETRHLRLYRVRLTVDDFEMISRLGSGYYGKVCLVRRRDNKNTLYAMKQLLKSQVFQENNMARVMAERDILAEANNEWIVELYYSFQDERYLYFIMEYIPGGDLMNLLQNKNVFPEDWAKFYIAEISLAVQYVHDLKFVHRDIKPDNILIDARGHIKLTDFGLCRGNRWTHDLSYYKDDSSALNNDKPGRDEHPTITEELTIRKLEHSQRKRVLSLVGSPHYIAPEVLGQVQHETKEELCDWWSVGVILYEMVVGYCPFTDLEKLKRNEINNCEQAIHIQYRVLNWRQHLEFPSEDPNSPPALLRDAKGKPMFISNEAKSLIQGWLCEPEKRLCRGGIRDIQNHPFFDGIDWKNIRKIPSPYVPELSDDLDTRHFDDAFRLSNVFDGTMGPAIVNNKSMTDFTYRYFYDN